MLSVPISETDLGHDTTTIHTNIVNKYDVSAEKAAADLDLFLNELAQRELIQDV